MPLVPDRLARLAVLIDQLLAQPEAARAAWLDALAADDAPLRPHLQALLDAETAAQPEEHTAAAGPGDTLWRLAPEAARKALRLGLAGESDEPRAGQRLGPWRLLEPLGRGGMGVVWRAERCDGAYQREVALKLPLPGVGPARMSERFAHERDILAALIHPHIARLYDAGIGSGDEGGAGASARPYLALELVDGEPITLWADHQALDVPGRIKLMLQVLQAVQYAHNLLIVHRDLKPSNILVSPDGQVHLLDFGIARLLDQSAPAASAGVGETGSSALTPTYAAPEQLQGLPVSTTADLYSLGVVLYELLAGTGPYRAPRSNRTALEQEVLTGRPPAPSLAAPAEAAARRSCSSSAVLRRQLRGDLDAIVFKALGKQPAERYASADAMAQDLQRHLQGLPVQAHPDNAAYRIGKFLRRHRAASAAGALALVAVLGGAGVAMWQAAVARQQAEHAQAQAARAEAAQGFLIELFNAADPARAQGREPGVRELMAYAEEVLPARLASQPELASTLRGALVEIYLKLSDEKRALPLAQARVAGLRERAGVSATELGQALLQLGTVQAEIGRNVDALPTYTEAERLLATPGVPPSDLWLALQARMANCLKELRRLPEARERMLAVIPALEARHGSTSWTVLQEKKSLLVIHSRLGEHDAAMALLRQMQPQLDQPDRAHAMDIARAQADIGQAMLFDGQWAEAERLLQRSLAELDRLVGPRNSVAIEVLKTRAQLLDVLGRVRETDAALQRLVTLAHAFYGDSDIQTALAESFRVAPLVKLGRMAQAEAAARRGLALAEGQPGLREGARRGLSRRLGLALLFNGCAAEALALLEEVARGDGDSRQWPTLIYLAGARLAQGQNAAAREAAQAAVDLAATKRPAADRLLHAKAQLTLALSLAALGQPEACEAPIAAAQATLRSLLPADSAEQTWPDLVRAQVLRSQHRDAQAAALEGPARRRWLQVSDAAPPSRLWLVH